MRLQRRERAGQYSSHLHVLQRLLKAESAAAHQMGNHYGGTPTDGMNDSEQRGKVAKWSYNSHRKRIESVGEELPAFPELTVYEQLLVLSDSAV